MNVTKDFTLSDSKHSKNLNLKIAGQGHKPSKSFKTSAKKLRLTSRVNMNRNNFEPYPDSSDYNNFNNYQQNDTTISGDGQISRNNINLIKRKEAKFNSFSTTLTKNNNGPVNSNNAR